VTMTDECMHGLDPATCTICNGKVAAERREARDRLDATYTRGDCRQCDAEIAWAEMPSGKMNPLDPEPAANGNVIIEGNGLAHVGKMREIEAHTGPRYTSHFATCPARRR
jgi:hypothetical protein